MIVQINKKLNKHKIKKDFFWYDPFFKETIKLNCENYKIITTYSPYCIVNEKPFKIEKSIELFKKHNNINSYSNDAVLNIMKMNNMVFYDYIQKAEPINSEDNKDFNTNDFYFIKSKIDELDLEYDILNKNIQGITINFYELDELKEDKLEDLFLILQKDYEIKVL